MQGDEEVVCALLGTSEGSFLEPVRHVMHGLILQPLQDEEKHYKRIGKFMISNAYGEFDDAEVKWFNVI